MSGTVYLVGAGPGDPGLITRRGAELLARAGCVIYDRLVNRRLLALAPRAAERVYAGKQADKAGVAQARINRLMIEKAGLHRTVVRLKGGDPGLFGRVTEEIEALERAGIRYEVVPGVSSVWAAAAEAGIPLTDRRVSSSVAFVTGHNAAGKRQGVRWESLAGADTLVILMGRASMPEIARRLIAAGRPAATPVAMIRWASMPQRELLVTTLGDAGRDLKRRPRFGPPVVTVVGEVVRLRRAKPLRGKRVLVTRASADKAGLEGKLAELGATCVTLPTIAVRPRRLRPAETARLLESLSRCDWLVLASRHGVEALDRIARARGKRLARLVRGKVCAVGPKTDEAARAAGLTPALVPSEFSKQGIVRAFRSVPLAGRRVLIPRSGLAAGDRFAAQLERLGARVEEAVVYDTVPVKQPAVTVRRAVRALDAATFTSASTVNGFFRALERAHLSARAVLGKTEVAAIGPSTAKALKAGGITRLRLPGRAWTVDGLVETVVDAIGNGDE